MSAGTQLPVEAPKASTIPGSFPTPNVLVDALMPLLSAEEYKVLSAAVRDILGYEDKRPFRRGRISVSRFMKLTGLGKETVIQALRPLTDCNVLQPIGKATEDGQEWQINFDVQHGVDFSCLQIRHAERQYKNLSRTQKARLAAEAKRVGRLTDTAVSQTDQQRSVRQTNSGQSDRLNQSNSQSNLQSKTLSATLNAGGVARPDPAAETIKGVSTTEQGEVSPSKEEKTSFTPVPPPPMVSPVGASVPAVMSQQGNEFKLFAKLQEIAASLPPDPEPAHIPIFKADPEPMREITGLPFKATTGYAYSPRENVGSRGTYHIVALEDMKSGQLERKTNDALCKPAREFWGLELGLHSHAANVADHPFPGATCKQCIEIAQRIQQRERIAAERAAKVKPPKDRPIDPLFDSVVACFVGKSRAEVTEADRSATSGRVGQIIHGVKAKGRTPCDGLLTFEALHQGIDKSSLDKSELADLVDLFVENLKKYHPGMEVKDCTKFMERYAKFRAAYDRKRKPATTQSDKSVFDMTPEELEAHDKQLRAEWGW